MTAAAAVLACAGPVPVAAQQQIYQYGTSIHPAYQGYVENADGSYTLVFQYFSEFRDTKELPVGPNNLWNGREDRGQITTFLPGNHEFVCVMVAENRVAAGQMRWTLAVDPDRMTGTSTDPLNTEYALVERAQEQANADIDPLTTPRGVCLNKPPAVNVGERRGRGGNRIDPGVGDVPVAAEVSAGVGEATLLPGRVEDEGLPRDEPMTIGWRQVSGPGTTTFGDASQATTSGTFSATGEYILELTANDGEFEHSTRLRVNVS